MRNIPKLKFNPSNYKTLELRELTEFIKDGTHASFNDTEDSDFKYLLSAKNVKNNSVNLNNDDRKISIDDFNTIFKKYCLLDGDILITIVGSIGELAIVKNYNKEYAFQRSVGIIRTNSLIDNQYLKYYLESPRVQKELQKRKNASAQGGIYLNELSKIKINYPEKSEQNKIADFLSVIDKKIFFLEDKVEALKLFKKGLAHKIFSHQIKYKNENGEDFKEWQYIPLKKIAYKIKSKNKNDDYNIVLTNSAKYGIVIQSSFFDRDITNDSNLNNYYIVDVDDFVYNPRTSIHAPVGPIKRNRIAIGVMSPLYTVFRFNRGNVEFYNQYYQTNLWHKNIWSISNIGARHDRMNICDKDFFNILIPFPSPAEQQKIASDLSEIDTKINFQQKKLKTLKQFTSKSDYIINYTIFIFFQEVNI